MFKAKILMIGPSESGKTVLSNFLADATESIGGDYSPTQGVRILEFECQNLNVKNQTCEVEMWDCAGDLKFESCWPAFMKDSSGVVIIFNPYMPSHTKEIEMWYSSFISAQRMQESQCLLIAHHKPGSGPGNGHSIMSSHLNKLPLIHSNLEDDPEGVRNEFKEYLSSVMKTLSETQDLEEMSIIT